MATQFWHWAVSQASTSICQMGWQAVGTLQNTASRCIMNGLQRPVFFPCPCGIFGGGRSVWFRRAQCKESPGGAQPWPRCAGLTWPYPAWKFHAHFFWTPHALVPPFFGSWFSTFLVMSDEAMINGDTDNTYPECKNSWLNLKKIHLLTLRLPVRKQASLNAGASNVSRTIQSSLNCKGNTRFCASVFFLM